MKTLASALALGALAAATTVHAAPNAERFGSGGHAVFVMTNDAEENQVIAFERSAFGTLGSPHRYGTGGRGSGGTVDPLASLTPDDRFVYASNAGTSSIAGFSIRDNGALVPLQSTVVGTNPAGATNLDITVSADGQFLYSLNGGSGSIGIFSIDSSDGSLASLGTLAGLPAAGGLNGIAAN